MTKEKLIFEYGKALGKYLYARNAILDEIKISKEEYEELLKAEYEIPYEELEYSDVFYYPSKETLRYKYYRAETDCKTYNLPKCDLKQLIIDAWTARNKVRNYGK